MKDKLDLIVEVNMTFEDALKMKGGHASVMNETALEKINNAVNMHKENLEIISHVDNNYRGVNGGASNLILDITISEVDLKCKDLDPESTVRCTDFFNARAVDNLAGSGVNLNDYKNDLFNVFEIDENTCVFERGYVDSTIKKGMRSGWKD